MALELAARNNVGQKREQDTHQEDDDEWIDVPHEVKKTLAEIMHGVLDAQFRRLGDIG
jgi:hypothetical protein